MEKFLVLLLVIAFSLSASGCTPAVKTDLNTLNQNPEQFQDKEVILVADLASVVETPDTYRGRKV